MSYSYNDFGPKEPGDTITVDFDYESREDVEVLVDGVPVDAGLWEWASDGLLLCKAGFPAGASGRVHRITDIAELKGRLTGTAVLDYPTINGNFDRLLFRLQEQDDGEANREARVVSIEEALEEQQDNLNDSVELGRRWAEEAEDVEVVPGHYSALHHSAKSQGAAALAGIHKGDALAARLGAENAQSAAEDAAEDAQDAMDEAFKWAEEEEDVEVVPGHYSALHWAKKAVGSVTGELAGWINAAAAKTTPDDNDRFPLTDSADGFSAKRTTWANIKAALTSVFLPLAGGTMTGLLTLVPADDDPDGTASLNIPAGADVPDVQVDGDLWADSNEDLRYRRGGVDATVYDSVSLPRPEAGEMAAGTETEPRAISAADVQAAVSARAIGIDQTWQDVSASRSQSTVYQNTTGKPIMVVVRVTGTTSGSLQVSPNGSSGWVSVGDVPNNSPYPNACGIVPDTWYYRATGTGGLIIWSELR